MKACDKPKVSFIIPTFNADRYLERCLRSITNQDYPQKNIEIIVSDGNSTDKTLNIAKKYGCKIFENPKMLAEPGKALGAKKANGSILFFIDSDNELTSNNWINKMIEPFENSNVYGVFTPNIDGPDEKAFTKYFNLLQRDPFSWYIIGKVNRYNAVKKFPVLKKTKDYIIFDYTTKRYDLIALAQGFAVRSDFETIKESECDDILPVIEIIKKKYRIAYVPDVGIYHHTLDSFSHFIRKFHKRIWQRINSSDYGYKTRAKYMSGAMKVRQYIWFLYSLTLIGPSIDMIKGFWRDRSIYWLYHPLSCFGLSCSILINYSIFVFNRMLKQIIRSLLKPKSK